MASVPGRTFDELYARHYDLLYADKDYVAECDLLDELFRRYGQGAIGSILDLGCGTGSHALTLSRRGYEVVGVDRSDAMLAQAQAKAERYTDELALNMPQFIQGNIGTMDLGRTFDAVLMLFAVLGYQLYNEHVLAALKTVRRHLKPGGLFICDVWYGPTVLRQGLSDRIKVASVEDGRIIRVASGELEAYTHQAHITYQMWRLKEQVVIDERKEFHSVRYFFPQELHFFAQQAQLNIATICSLEDVTRQPDESCWNAWVVARASE